MNQFLRGLSLCLILIVSVAGFAVQAATPKAIFIIVDGIPADVIEKVDTPYLDAIASKGGYTRAYTGGEIGGQTQNPTISAVGYMNLITGTWANKHNVWGNKVKKPDYQYWDIFRIARAHNPQLHTALFSTWEDNRTKLIGNDLPQAGGNKLSYAFDGFEDDTDRFPHDKHHRYIEKIDDLVAQETARYITDKGPDLSWVYLEYTDSAAHGYGDSDEFTSAVKRADNRVGQIWKAILQREKEFDEDWLLVITTDHGRDVETGKNHGGQSQRERTIWVTTNSRDLNDNFGEKTAIVDILPSITTHMGISINELIESQLDGRSFIGD
ncbi:MAG: putative AlkP superfamily pyrophosphatase or phosphodiesterase [Cryomorphaceae bacterium]|jgi:predicted AlkP superfamily pyrophosphatase or phosphodiesterase